MDDYISRAAATEVLCDACGNAACPKGIIPKCSYYDKMQTIPPADVRPVVYCRDCKYRPYSSEPGKTSGFAVESPDRECKCPCFNPDDGYYSWIPDDYFFCGNGERRSADMRDAR